LTSFSVGKIILFVIFCRATGGKNSFFAGKNFFFQDSFLWKKNVFFTWWRKTCQPCHWVCILQEIPGGLPGTYQKALNRRYKSIESWQQFVHAAGLTKDQRRTFGGVVEARFQVRLAKLFFLFV